MSTSTCAFVPNLTVTIQGLRNPIDGRESPNFAYRAYIDFLSMLVSRLSGAEPLGSAPIFYFLYRGVEATSTTGSQSSCARARDPDPASAGLASSIFWLGTATGRIRLGARQRAVRRWRVCRGVYDIFVFRCQLGLDLVTDIPFNTALPERQERLRGALCPLRQRAAKLPPVASSIHGGPLR